MPTSSVRLPARPPEIRVQVSRNLAIPGVSRCPLTRVLQKLQWCGPLLACLLSIFPSFARAQGDFTGTFDTFNQTVAPGQAAVYNLTIVPLNGFTGNVTMSASNLPPGTTVSFSPQTVTGGSGLTAVTVQTSSFTPLNTYDVTITGVSDSLVHSAAITLNVGANGDFIGSFDHTTATVAPGSSTPYVLTLTPLQGFNANVALSTSGLPTGTTGTFSPATVVGGSGSSTLTVAVPSSTPTGQYTFTVTATTPGLTHTTNIYLLVGAPDFTGSLTPTFQAVAPGGSAQYTLTLKTIGTQPFGSNVTPTVSGLPAGVTASFNPPNVNPDASGSSVLTLTTSANTPQGTFLPLLTVSGGGYSHGMNVTLSVSSARTTGDFIGSFDHFTATALPGSPATYTLTLTGNSFSGNVALSADGLPYDTTASFSPSLVVNGSGTSVLTVSVAQTTPPGEYTINIHAYSGAAFSHSTTLTLLAGMVDFTGSVTPPNQGVMPGETAKYNISLSTLGTVPFGNSVELYVSDLPPGATASFSPPSISPDSNGSSILTLVTSRSTPVGTLPPLLVATGGSSTHDIPIGLAVTAGDTFTTSGNLNTPRVELTTTLLNSGKVLIAGGDDFSFATFNEQLFDPLTQGFTSTGTLNNARGEHTATLLNNGQVLIAGGAAFGALSSAELYDPATRTFTLTGSMSTPRTYATATLLSNGRVLVAGGASNSGLLSSAELYDPAAGTFTLTGALNIAREDATATPLNNGKVLIVGGETSSAELYDPASGTFTLTGSLNTERYGHTATLLNNGEVLIAGGFTISATVLASLELYDPSSGTFAAAGTLNTARGGHTATLLNNGQVLIAGGTDAGCICSTPTGISTAELYDPVSGTATLTGSLNTGRFHDASTLLENGRVLLTGGTAFSNGGALASTEIFEPARLTPAGLVSITVTPGTVSLSPGTTQRFIATGTFSDGSTQQLASVTWSSSDPNTVAISNDISNSGTATLVGATVTASSVTISAADGALSGSAVLNVQPTNP